MAVKSISKTLAMLLCGVTVLCGLDLPTHSAQFQIDISSFDSSPALLTVDVGDTITWTQQDYFTNWISVYPGAWRSPLLTNGQNVSLTMTNPGTYAFGTAIGSVFPSLGAGAIVVNGWSNEPPRVTLNAPMDGIEFNGYQYSIDINVTVRIPLTNVQTVAIFANTNLLGVITNAPFRLTWENATNGHILPIPSGDYRLQAQVTDGLGRLYSSQPVSILLDGPSFRLLSVSNPRILSDGTFVAHWSSGAGQVGDLYYYTNLFDAFSAPLAWLTNGIHIAPNLIGNGVILDPQALRNGRVRFYMLWRTGP